MNLRCDFGLMTLLLAFGAQSIMATPPDSSWAVDTLPLRPLITVTAIEPTPIAHRAIPEILPPATTVQAAIDSGLSNTNPAGGDCAPDTSCGQRGKFIGGAGLSFVQPYFQNNPAVSFFRQGTGPGQRYDINQSMGAAPLVWLGYQGENGLGARARWWYFREGTQQRYNFGPSPDGGTGTAVSAAPLGAAIIADNPQAFAVTSKFQLQVADLEVFQDASFCNWNLQFSGGFGYADITQNYGAYAIAASGGPARPLNSSSSFVGIGPVVALEARRPILGNCLSLYGSSRTRILFGSAKQTAVGGDELNGAQGSRQDGVVTIEELELGIEYSKTCGRRRYFGRLGMIAQEWFGAGNATRSTRVSPPTTIPIFSGEDNSNFGLFGLALRVGVEF